VDRHEPPLPIRLFVAMAGLFSHRGLEPAVVDTIRDNTRRGLAHARAQGRVGGRPSVMTPERTAAAVRMHEQGESVAQIARVLGVGASSVSRALAKAVARPS
jgi:DNA invertase Pin-like site-specific DNA recombinase